MKTFAPNEFKQALLTLGINSRKHVLIHSSLVSLGQLAGPAIKHMPHSLFEALFDTADSQANIYMPTFSYDFPKTRTADLRSQKTSLGVWPEWFRQNTPAHRSGHPMFSIAGLGPDAHKICQPDQPEANSFCEQSTYARLFEQDTLILFIGIGIRVATPIVYVEAQMGVRYRFLKPFFGTLTLQNGTRYEQGFYHYCYPMTNEYRNDFSRLETHLLERQILRKKTLGMSSIYAIYAQDLYTAIESKIQSNPFYLLNARPKQYYEYQNGHEVPIVTPDLMPESTHHQTSVG